MSQPQPNTARAHWWRPLPGLMLTLVVTLAALFLSEVGGAFILRLMGFDPAGKGSPLAVPSVAVLLGVLLGNTLSLPGWLKPGIQFSVKKLLRLGIILVGIKLSLLELAALGAWGVPIVVVSIATGLLTISWLNRALGLPERLGTLTAVGTSICGVTAILSIAPSIEADEQEVAYAVANVTLFGLLAMFTYPYLAPLLLPSSTQVGLFLGTAIHDTSQVVGAALTYRELHHDDLAFKVATVTKLLRNLFLVAVVPLAAYLHAKRKGVAGARTFALRRIFPVFILGFVAMALVRTAGDALLERTGSVLGLADRAGWQAATGLVGEKIGAKYLLAMALAGVGLETRFAMFRQVGWKPLAVGMLGALVVGLAGLLMALAVGPLL